MGHSSAKKDVLRPTIVQIALKTSMVQTMVITQQ